MFVMVHTWKHVSKNGDELNVFAVLWNSTTPSNIAGTSFLGYFNLVFYRNADAHMAHTHIPTYTVFNNTLTTGTTSKNLVYYVISTKPTFGFNANKIDLAIFVCATHNIDIVNSIMCVS